MVKTSDTQWFNHPIPKLSYYLPRLESTGDGVCILLRKSVHFSEITISDNVEILAVDVCVSQNIVLLWCIVHPTVQQLTSCMLLNLSMFYPP